MELESSSEKGFFFVWEEELVNNMMNLIQTTISNDSTYFNKKWYLLGTTIGAKHI
jgi:hypothetical protein